MSPLILVRGLRYRYDDGTLALNGVDFRLDTGETVALLGANGSGKTTFALQLNGLLSGEGTVEVCGLPVNPKNLAEGRRKIGLVFQDSESQLFMPTVLEDVAFGPLNHGLGPQKAAERAMAALLRMSSLAALTAAALAPLYALMLHAGRPVIVLAVAMAVLIFIRHHENIARLLKGVEPKIGGAKPPAEAA